VKLAIEAPVPKLISWNIAGRVKGRGAQLGWIASERPDFLALQEVRNASDLQQRLSALGFKSFASTEPTDGRNKLVAIASREPFRRISTFAVPHPERAISCRILLRSKEVELHCLHVPPGESYGRIKIEFLETVISGLSTRAGPHLLVGDFNCPQVMEPEESKIVTWAQWPGNDGRWQPIKSYKGVDFERWDKAERTILRPKDDMKDAYTSVNGVVKYTYPAKAKGGPNCFDHMIASVSIMPSRIRVADSVLEAKLSDHAALVAEW
jgi:endonuclease/exonuclease/phosphatase family metal-dependent hydrolase